LTHATDRSEWDRVPITLSSRETGVFAETYGFTGTQGVVWLEGQHFRPRNRPSDTVYIIMHPTSSLQTLPLPTAMAERGLHVICANSRYARNDAALIMEKVCYDLGRYVRWAKEVAGYRRIILVGWSGGGALSLFYQSQAENPTITHTPAGDPYDLTAAKLIPAQGVIFIAAHLSRAETLAEVLDPSVRDELNPDDRDPELDIYSADCPNRPPYTAEFIARFRAAQLQRNRRITAWVEQTLQRLKSRNDGEVERSFVVHRTWCDVRWLDLTVDPNGRQPNKTVLGDPRIANCAPAGLARFTSLRSWLSQWSIDRSQAKGPVSARHIKRTPVLLVDNEADDGVPATHNPIIHEALGTPDKEMISIAGANHYYVGQPEQLGECLDKVIEWSRRKQLLD
jgi:pimeloyl-ACP methyl ester carboxylesterase